MEKTRNYEENRFHKARYEIGKIHEPVDIAAAEYASAHGWDWTDTGEAQEDYEEFLAHVHELQRKTNAHHNYVSEYFGV